MASFEELLVPQGMQPFVIDQGSGQSGLGLPTDRLSTAVRALQKVDREREQRELKEQEKLKNQISMFATLRDSGLSPDKAAQLVREKFSDEDFLRGIPEDLQIENDKEIFELEGGELKKRGTVPKSARVFKGEKEKVLLPEVKFKGQVSKEDVPRKKTGLFKSEPAFSEETRQVINSIKTINDLEKLILNRQQAEAVGVDVDAVIEFFRKEE